jgi:hypothetical protein
LHHFSDIVGQRHGGGVGRLVGPTKLRLHVWRGKFENLHGRTPELRAERLQPRVKKGLTRAVRWRLARGTKAKPEVVVMIVEFACCLRAGSSAAVK